MYQAHQSPSLTDESIDYGYDVDTSDDDGDFKLAPDTNKKREPNVLYYCGHERTLLLSPPGLADQDEFQSSMYSPIYYNSPPKTPNKEELPGFSRNSSLEVQEVDESSSDNPTSNVSEWKERSDSFYEEETNIDYSLAAYASESCEKKCTIVHSCEPRAKSDIKHPDTNTSEADTSSGSARKMSLDEFVEKCPLKELVSSFKGNIDNVGEARGIEKADGINRKRKSCDSLAPDVVLVQIEDQYSEGKLPKYEPTIPGEGCYIMIDDHILSMEENIKTPQEFTTGSHNIPSAGNSHPCFPDYQHPNSANTAAFSTNDSSYQIVQANSAESDNHSPWCLPGNFFISRIETNSINCYGENSSFKIPDTLTSEKTTISPTSATRINNLHSCLTRSQLEDGEKSVCSFTQQHSAIISQENNEVTVDENLVQENNLHIDTSNVCEGYLASSQRSQLHSYTCLSELDSTTATTGRTTDIIANYDSGDCQMPYADSTAANMTDATLPGASELHAILPGSSEWPGNSNNVQTIIMTAPNTAAENIEVQMLPLDPSLFNTGTTFLICVEQTSSGTMVDRAQDQEYQDRNQTPDVKNKLKNIIKRKRQIEGKEEIEIKFEPPPPSEMSKEEKEKKERQKEQNKIAAANHRKKKKEEEKSVEQELEEQERKSEELKKQCSKMQLEKQRFIAWLRSRGIPIPPSIHP